MAELEYYTNNIYFNKQLVDINSSLYSFTISDSLYSLYSTGLFTLNDETGLLQEFLTTIPGQYLKIEFGAEDDLFAAPMVLNSEFTEEITHPGLLNGPVNMTLIHEWFNYQEQKSVGYKDKISSIVKKLVGAYNFNNVDIDDTGNNDYWYQPLMTDAKFINDILLKYAFSTGSSNTPYYAFITNDNTFNFKYLKSLENQSPEIEIDYKVEMGTKNENKQTKKYRKTQTLQKQSYSLKDIYNLKKREAYYISRTDGTLIEKEDLITDYPDARNLNPPIVKKENVQTGNIYLGKEKKETGAKENLQGLQVNSMREGMFLDRFILLIPFHPLIKSGKAVQLNIFTMENNQTQISKRYSGKYIVENCEQIWEGENHQGFTKIIVGRKYIQIPSAYSLKAGLMP